MPATERNILINCNHRGAEKSIFADLISSCVSYPSLFNKMLNGTGK
jgi:hypothetical protein